MEKDSRNLSILVGQGARRCRVCRQVGLEHRTRAPIRAIGVDELQYTKGHKYLTLVNRCGVDPLALGRYRSPSNPLRDSSPSSEPNWPPRPNSSARTCGNPTSSRPREMRSQALNILDRFHIEAKMTKALDEVQSACSSAKRISPANKRAISANCSASTSTSGVTQNRPVGVTSKPAS